MTERGPDIIVIGGGGSGLAAAVAAAELGRSVVVLQKYAEVGGTTVLSVGSISGAGTALQARAGITDNVKSFRADMPKFWGDLAPRAFGDLQDLLAEESARTIDWLEELGVVFAGPFPEPPHEIDRMHNAIPNSRSFVDVLMNAAKKAGVDVRTGCCVTRLIQDQSGRVTGVAYTQSGQQRELKASRGVVLATGDFSGSPELKKRFLTQAQQNAIVVRPESTGTAM